MKFTDLSGKKFNSVLVLRVHPQRDKAGRILWECKCDCGKEFLVRTYPLGKIKSCGCEAIKNLRSKDTAINMKYIIYNNGAIERGHSFDLTKDEFKQIITSNCYYCDGEPALWSPYVRKDGTILPSLLKRGMNEDYVWKETFIPVNGIDRIDNDKGYTKENTVACCQKCNMMKHTLPEKEFLDHAIKIAHFQDRKAIEDKTLIEVK